MVDSTGIIIGIVGIIVTLITVYRKNSLRKLYFYIKKPFSRLCLIEQAYYSHEFVREKIKKSSRIIRILCVRNIRITEPDMIEEIKKFILKRNGNIEILALSPFSPEYAISEIMCTLPKPPKSVEQFKKDVCVNYDYIFDLYQGLGEKKSHFSYYEYNALPLIHMCQFDDFIYLGFQLYYKECVEDSLLEYCVEIPEKSKLGEKLLNQFDYLKKEKSTNIFESEKYNVFCNKGRV